MGVYYSRLFESDTDARQTGRLYSLNMLSLFHLLIYTCTVAYLIVSFSCITLQFSF